MTRRSASLFLVLIPVVLFDASMRAHAAACTLPGLHWMAADWNDAASPASSQEKWTALPNGVLMGTSFEVTPEGKGFTEIMTVREEAGSIRMVLRHFDLALSKAWEERTVPMVFVASSCDATSAVFDGQDDHAGEHLTYKRSGDALLIVGDFLHHGTPDHEQWHMVAAH